MANIIFLTADFYRDFSHFSEIEQKDSRPYIMFVVCFNDLDFAIPFRSNIQHRHYYKTSASGSVGIDYSKSLIIPDSKYLGKKATIRKEEAFFVIGKDGLIKKGFIEYINKYIIAINRLVSGKGAPKDYYLCKFSTLQNFHAQLKIPYNYHQVMVEKNLVFRKKPDM